MGQNFSHFHDLDVERERESAASTLLFFSFPSRCVFAGTLLNQNAPLDTRHNRDLKAREAKKGTHAEERKKKKRSINKKTFRCRSRPRPPPLLLLLLLLSPPSSACARPRPGSTGSPLPSPSTLHSRPLTRSSDSPTAAGSCTSLRPASRGCRRAPLPRRRCCNVRDRGTEGRNKSPQPSSLLPRRRRWLLITTIKRRRGGA